MTRNEIEARLGDIIDKLADVEHDRWAHWQRYLHSKCQRLPDGSMVIPHHLVTQWERQIATPYDQLTERERESDREQVRKYLPLIIAAVER